MYYTDDMVSNGLYLTWIYAYLYSPEYNLKQANCVSYLCGHHDKTFEISHLREERFVLA